VKPDALFIVIMNERQATLMISNVPYVQTMSEPHKKLDVTLKKHRGA
jgi:hypothetical protein